MRRHLLSLTAALCLCCSSRAQWQEGTGFTRYTRLEGLSNNNISGIVQDTLGYPPAPTASSAGNKAVIRIFTS